MNAPHKIFMLKMYNYCNSTILKLIAYTINVKMPKL